MPDRFILGGREFVVGDICLLVIRQNGLAQECVIGAIDPYHLARRFRDGYVSVIYGKHSGGSFWLNADGGWYPHRIRSCRDNFAEHLDPNEL